MGKTIAIVSGKGGVGKTTATAYIGIALSIISKKVLLIDGNFGLRNLDLLLEMENDAVYNLTDIISGFCDKDEVILQHPFYKNISFLPCPQTKQSDAVSLEEMKNLVENLKNDYDYILIDCPAGLEKGYQLGTCAADAVIVVSELSVQSIRNTDSVIQNLKRTGFKEIYCLVNMVDREAIRSGKSFDFQTFFEVIYEPLIGVIFSSDEIRNLLFSGSYFEELSKEEQSCFFHIAKRLTGEEIPLPEIALQATEDSDGELSIDQLLADHREKMTEDDVPKVKENSIMERLKNLFMNRKE